ncbi:hypothetical protein [Jeotgalibaca sp. A127]|uniref:hypothetical protein n=2 Tax=unclassified Jeotgalibaca TaxID=2621505 RepID=UPI003FD41BCF
MFEVNFFEKKQKNYLPHLLTLLSFLLLLGIGIYLFMTRAFLLNTDDRNSNWLADEANRITISRQMKHYQQTAAQLNEDKVLFEERQYPMATAAEAIISIIPGGSATIITFSLDETNQVTLVLNDLSVKEIDETILKYRQQAYVTNVQLIRVENQAEEAGSLAEIWLTLDEDALRGEVQP